MAIVNSEENNTLHKAHKPANPIRRVCRYVMYGTKRSISIFLAVYAPQSSAFGNTAP